MSRISKKFHDLSLKNERALIAYVMAGFPNQTATLSAVRGLVDGGADIVELGLAFSDPLADGPVIQNAASASISCGFGVEKFFETVKKIRRHTNVPLVLMTYANMLYHTGYPEFVSRAVDAGIDGFIIPDMPIEESAAYLAAARGKVDAIFLASPNTSRERIGRIADATSGFLYLVALYGTTGTQAAIPKYATCAVRDIKRQVGSKIPLGVGFGVSTPEDVKRYVAAGADAVIVGSAFVRLVQKTPSGLIRRRVASFTRRLKKETRPDG